MRFATIVVSSKEDFSKRGRLGEGTFLTETIIERPAILKVFQLRLTR